MLSAVIADVHKLPPEVAEDLGGKGYAIGRVLNREIAIILPTSSVKRFGFHHYNFLFARLSEDGSKLITFTPNSHANGLPPDRIALIGSDGAVVKQLRIGLADVRAASLSPNGDFVAFVGTDRQTHSTGVQYAQFSDPKSFLIERIERDALWNPGTLGWSPDSRRIVYSAARNIKIFDTDSRHSVVIAAGLDPGWSPDGKQISFRSLAGDGMLSNPDGTGLRAIERKHKVLGALRWSPDGNYLFGIVNWDKVDTSLTCFGNTRLVIYRTADGASFPFYNPCGMKEEFFGWVRDPMDWGAQR
jgi:WD40 repeat protein